MLNVPYSVYTRLLSRCSEDVFKYFLQSARRLLRGRCTVLCLLQATSPQTTSKDLQAAHKDFLSKGAREAPYGRVELDVARLL